MTLQYRLGQNACFTQFWIQIQNYTAYSNFTFMMMIHTLLLSNTVVAFLHLGLLLEIFHILYKTFLLPGILIFFVTKLMI